MEKQFKPSFRRLKRAREAGNLAKSQYLSQSSALTIGVLAVYLGLSNSWVEHELLIEYLWTEGFKAPYQAAALIASKYFVFTLKILIIVAIAGFSVEATQVGFHISPSLLAFKLGRAGPVSGSKKIFQNLKNIWLLVLKLTAFFAALSWFFYSFLKSMDGLVLLPSGLSGTYFFRLVFKLAILLGVLSLTLGLIDYFVRKRKWFKEVGMSLEDMRRENKEEEGDPLFKSLRKHQHRELMQQDLIRRIRAARVVIVERAV